MPALLDVDGLARGDKYLSFRLGAERFAIGILAIKGIIEYRAPTLVPMMPPCVLGVLNLRGAVVPVIDLLLRFGRAPSEVTRRSCIVIVDAEIDGERHVIGAKVDRVDEVLAIGVAELEPAPAFGNAIRSEFVQGIGKLRSGFVTLLEMNAVLSIGALESAADPPAAAAPAAPA